MVERDLLVYDESSAKVVFVVLEDALIQRLPGAAVLRASFLPRLPRATVVCYVLMAHGAGTGYYRVRRVRVRRVEDRMTTERAEYLTSVTSCTCPDATYRKAVCKHQQLVRCVVSMDSVPVQDDAAVAMPPVDFDLDAEEEVQ